MNWPGDFRRAFLIFIWFQLVAAVGGSASLDNRGTDRGKFVHVGAIGRSDLLAVRVIHGYRNPA